VTREQGIVLGLFALAFVGGWVARALVDWRRRPASESAPAAVLPLPGTQSAFGQTRDELTRAIRAYHATVAVSHERAGDDEASIDDPDHSRLELLARALASLAIAVEQASGELDVRDPLAARLRSAGDDLRDLSLDVLMHAREDQVPTSVLDRLEQHLTAAAAAIFTSARPQPLGA
jgi:hypothetical protein